MDPAFVEAYRAVSPTPSDELLKARWSGIESYGKGASAGTLLDAVRTFYGLPCRTPTFPNEFRANFTAHDVAFPASGNEFEVRILAGSALLAIFASGRKLAALTALALISGYYRGNRKDDLPAIVVTRAREYLLNASRDRTQKPEIKKPPLPPKIEEGTDAATLAKAALDLTKTVNQFVQHSVRELDVRLASIEEETNIFWWLLAGYSRDLEKPLSQISRSARPLVAGKEMADLVSLMPGPVGAPALLDKLLSIGRIGRGKVSPAEAIKAAPLDWIVRWARGNESIEHCSPLCPILFAAQRYAEAPGADAWVGSVKSSSGLAIDTGLSPLELALQMYDECRFVRVYGEIISGAN
jgi:hypothetical protein